MRSSLAVQCLCSIRVDARLLKHRVCPGRCRSGDLADVLVRAVTYWDTLWFEEWFTYWSFSMACPFLAWAALETLRLCGPQAPNRMTSFDAIAASRADAGRFLGLWTTLAMLVLCALPPLFVVAAGRVSDSTHVSGR